MMGNVAQSRKPSWSEDNNLLVTRNGYREETYFTYSYSPLFLDNGTVGGLYAATHETTLRVISERQMRCVMFPEVAAAAAHASRYE
jgi:hypothetical protein